MFQRVFRICPDLYLKSLFFNLISQLISRNSKKKLFSLWHLWRVLKKNIQCMLNIFFTFCLKKSNFFVGGGLSPPPPVKKKQTGDQTYKHFLSPFFQFCSFLNYILQSFFRFTLSYVSYYLHIFTMTWPGRKNVRTFII